ncbi:hypothetical protein V1523DRAFT_438445 [Lipomyces doorenjongii]
MDTDEEIRVRQPDNEHEFSLSEESYNLLRTECVKDEYGNANALGFYPRLLYDWTRQVITIYLQPREINMQQEQIQIGPNEKLRITHSPTILIQTGLQSYRSWRLQPYDSLLQKARKWIIEQKCEIVILLAFNEKSHYSAPVKPISLTTDEIKAETMQMRQIWLCYPKFCTLEFLGHIWFGEHFESFIEVVRNGNLIVDFFDAVDFMDIIRCTMIETAVKRLQRAVKVRS